MKIKSAIGIRRTTVELTDDVTTVDFGHDYKYFAIRNDGSGSIYVSTANKECTAGEDEVVLVPSGSSYVHYNGYGGNTGIYISGTGTATVVAQDDGNNPFKGAQGGGDYAVAGASSYTLNNAVDYPLLGLNLYGKSTQDGTPTPENPVEIVSVGDSGSVAVQACGKNLVDYAKFKTKTDNGVSFINNNDGSITVSGKKTDITKNVFIAYTLTHDESTRLFTPGTYSLSGIPSEYDNELYFYVNLFYGNSWHNQIGCSKVSNKKITFEIKSEYIEYDDYKVDIGIFTTKNFEVRTGTFYLQIEKGSTVTDFEPYKANTASITTALPLCGIPVSEGGNYTDGNGQRWVCDTLVYNADGTGKIIKQFGKFIVDGTESSYKNQSESTSEIAILDTKFEPIKNPKYTTITALVMSDIFKADTAANTWNGVNDNSIAINRYGANLVPAIRVYSSKFTNIDDAKTYFTSNPMTFIAELETPQEIELTAVEMTELMQLQTFDGVSNITNGSSADMDVSYCTNKMLSKYVIPITTGLQKQIDELKAAVISLGGNV